MKSDVSSIAFNNRILENIADFNTLEEAALELARIVMVEVIEKLDEQLLETAPRGWVCIGKRKRTLATRVGEIEITRRFYCKTTKKGKKYRFLLDEALHIRKRRRVTNGLLKLMVAMATRLPFREVSEVLEEAGLPVLSHSTVHQEVKYYGALASKCLEKDRKAVFEAGQDAGQDQQRSKVPILFLEADGITVNSQRCEKKRLEIKVGISYEGWNGSGKSRTLKRPRVVMGLIDGGDRFWETFSADLQRRYELLDTQIIINGDGASWIHSISREYFAGAIIQLDRYHLKRDLRLVLGPEAADKLYAQLQQGQSDVFIDTLESLESEIASDKRPMYEKLLNLCKRYREHLGDYRSRIARRYWKFELYGMGVAETTVDKKIANRMKKRGMSWSREGASAMATLLMLRSNKELFNFLDEARLKDIANPVKKIRHFAKEAIVVEPGTWMQARMPKLVAAWSPTTKALRDLSKPSGV